MQVPLDSAALGAWLASPLPQAAQFHDWAKMNPAWDEAWRSDFVTLPAASVGDFLAGWEAPASDSAGMAWCHDPTQDELRLGAENGATPTAAPTPASCNCWPARC